ncbi:MAG: GNAT family N-acetyltransferase [Planctomycetota bacterium]|nr:GNAT family N-acetyltransferase [Planctomycetota bacterium]
MTQKPHLIISDVRPEHYEPIRKMRLHPANQPGFLEQRPFSQADQERYMAANADKYIVCLLGEEPVGYAGVIENDIRICTDPDFKKRGIGAAMLREIARRFPNARAKILRDNKASQALFRRSGVPFEVIDAPDQDQS